MAQTFDITTTATAPLKANDKGHTEAVFTVTNNTPRPVRGQASAKALDSAKEEWLKITGDLTRDFPPRGTQQYVVTFDAPIAAAPKVEAKPAGSPSPATPATADMSPADKYGFRLRVALTTNPDEDFTEGPVVTVELPKPKVETSKPFPKWIFIPIAAVVLIGIAVGLYFALRSKGISVPNVVGMKLADAKAALEAKALKPVEQKVEITGAHPPGEVTAQSPEPGGSPVPKNTEVNLTTEGEVPLVEVPDVTKRLVQDARERLKKESLGVVEKSTDVIEGLQPDQVVSQDPVGGTKVKLPTTVTLVVAVQRQVVVPDVTFKPLNIAEQQITAVGLKVVEKDPELAPPNVAPGNVKSQNPAANTKVPPGSAVELVAAAQPTSVPDVRQRRIADAQIILQQAGLDLGTVSGTVNTTNASTVLITGQDPGAGASVARGARVNVSVPFICTFIRACISVTDRVDISTVRRLDPAIKQPLFQRKQ